MFASHRIAPTRCTSPQPSLHPHCATIARTKLAWHNHLPPNRIVLMRHVTPLVLRAQRAPVEFDAFRQRPANVGVGWIFVDCLHECVQHIYLCCYDVHRIRTVIQSIRQFGWNFSNWSNWVGITMDERIVGHFRRISVMWINRMRNNSELFSPGPKNSDMFGSFYSSKSCILLVITNILFTTC